MGKIDSAWQGATGAGLEENVTTAYHYLANNYEKGDEIFLFGFSRGAYTVRALAGMVTEMGLLWPQKLSHFPDLYKLYRKRRDNDGTHVNDVSSNVHSMNEASPSDVRKDVLTDRYTGKFWKPAKEMQSHMDKKLWNNIKQFHPDNADNKESTSHISHVVRIKVIGVWDTVGSRGLPKSLLSSLTGYNEKYRFHDTALNRKIDHDFHALSLDEHRGAFEPTLWYLDRSSTEYGATTDLKQCWFPGFHADIGGGTTSGGTDHTSHIDQITLAWMCDLVDGLLDFDEKACHELLHLKKSRTSEVLTERRKWAEGDTNDSSILYNLPIAGGYVVRTPGAYHEGSEDEEYAKVTNETVHPSVHYRHDKKGYDPPALKQHPRWFNGKNPVWRFEELEGKGAQWVRPKVPEKKSMIWGTVNAKREVKLDEWWIREIQGPHRLNLEWNLLPPTVKDMLQRRNDCRPYPLTSSEGQPPIYCRNVY